VGGRAGHLCRRNRTRGFGVDPLYSHRRQELQRAHRVRTAIRRSGTLSGGLRHFSTDHPSPIQDPPRSVWFGGAALRRQACGIPAEPIGSITEICFSCGFDNSSHFSVSRRASIGTHRLAAKTSRSSVGHVRVGRIPVSLLSGPYEAKRRWHKQTKVVAHGHATGRDEF
jgi:AraC-like DNA-binding protein